MTGSPSLDQSQAHRFFSVECFNRAWDLLDKPNRSADDDEQMLLLSHASLWHWTQRADCTDRNLSIGYWQLSRVYATLGQANNARRHAEASLRLSQSEPPFYRGYAHEALARAAMIAGDRDQLASSLAESRKLLPEIADAEERATLEKDLSEIELIADHADGRG
jgi:hypothetical protein